MAYGSHKFATPDRPIHDACVPGYLLVPEAFAFKDCNVVIETRSPETEGMTVVDWWGVTKRPKNAMVMRDIDAEAFFAMLTERLGTLG